MNRVSLTAQLCIFGAVFLLGFITVAACNSVFAGLISDQRTVFLLISVLQGLFAFCLPSIVAGYFDGRNCLKTLSLDKNPGWKAIIGIFLSFALGFIFLNQIIYWNDTISLPVSMKDIEFSLRKMEDTARDTASIILGDTSVIGLLTSILVVGIITGFSEELFFRAGLQRLLYGAMSKHAAIWLTAIIFSLMHFQFFGFIPRVLLGAFFGYLYFWTGSVWTSIIGHSLNNSIVVISEWLISRNVVSYNFDSLGITEHRFPWPALISCILFSLFLTTRRFWFSSKQTHSNKK